MTVAAGAPRVLEWISAAMALAIQMTKIRRKRGWALRIALVIGLCASTTGALSEGSRRVLPVDGEVAMGVVFDGAAVDPGVHAEALVKERAAAILARPVVLRRGDQVLLRGTLGEIGASIDVERAVSQLEAVGRSGSIEERLDEAWEARHHRVVVSLPVTLPAEIVAARLAEVKEAFDHPAQSARWDFAKATVLPHRPGELIDIHAAVDELRSALAAAPHDATPLDVAVPITVLEPAATTEAVAALDRSVKLSSFETRFGYVGNQVGRAQNVTRAASGIDGLVMMPGQIVGFNELVGPRSLENGFAEAGEIYKGEMRMGVGGGTCQVASTYHAAAYLGGLEVVERSPHSRPSGYIRIGLDATVAYPTVDLKLRNPFSFPVLVHAFIQDRGTLVVEIFGSAKPVEVAFNAATVGIKDYKRSVRTASWLESGRIIRKQPGRKGVTIQKIRTLHFDDGTERVEETLDHYPPTTEIYYVPVGTDVDAELPPLPASGAPTAPPV